MQPFAGKQDGMVARNLANPTGQPIPDWLAHHIRNRPPHERTKLPEPGQVVGYRHEPHGPVSQAQVIRVDMGNRQDWNVWKFATDPRHGENRPIEVNGKRVMVLVDDPWPDVYLRTDYGHVVTREARAPGSAGWLHLKTGA